MSLCRLSLKNVLRVNREYGTEFIHAASEPDGDIVGVAVGGEVLHLCRHDGSSQKHWASTTTQVHMFDWERIALLDHICPRSR